MQISEIPHAKALQQHFWKQAQLGRNPVDFLCCLQGIDAMQEFKKG